MNYYNVYEEIYHYKPSFYYYTGFTFRFYTIIYEVVFIEVCSVWFKETLCVARPLAEDKRGRVISKEVSERERKIGSVSNSDAVGLLAGSTTSILLTMCAAECDISLGI